MQISSNTCEKRPQEEGATQPIAMGQLEQVATELALATSGTKQVKCCPKLSKVSTPSSNENASRQPVAGEKSEIPAYLRSSRLMKPSVRCVAGVRPTSLALKAGEQSSGVERSKQTSAGGARLSSSGVTRATTTSSARRRNEADKQGELVFAFFSSFYVHLEPPTNRASV